MIQFFTHIKQGVITNPKVIRKHFDQLADGAYLVKIESKKKRSLPQNAYLHGIIIPMVYEGLRDAGFDQILTHEDAKTVIKSLFLKKSIVSKETGEMIEVVRGTSELTTLEFNELIDAVIKWGAEYLSIQIPYPHENITLF